MTASVTRFDIGEATIEVVRKDSQNVHLVVCPAHGHVRIAAPLHTTDDAVRIFAIARMPWIRRQQGKSARQGR